MTETDLIYAALLRAEKRIEDAYREASAKASPACTHLAGASMAIQVIREEIGNGMAVRALAGLDAISGKGG